MPGPCGYQTLVTGDSDCGSAFRRNGSICQQYLTLACMYLMRSSRGRPGIHLRAWPPSSIARKSCSFSCFCSVARAARQACNRMSCKGLMLP